MNRQIILEDGYNTSYIYSLITALFHTRTDAQNKLLTLNESDGCKAYVQEYIKTNFILPLHRGMSIHSRITNKFRLFIHHMGWLTRADNESLLENACIKKFYSFLVSTIMEQNLMFTRVDTKCNKSDEVKFDMIHLDESHANQIYGSVNVNNQIVNVSDMLKSWIDRELTCDKFLYQFFDIPTIIPISLNFKDPSTKTNTKYINLNEGIQFYNINDSLSKILIWDIHSLICEDINGCYYSVVNTANGWVWCSDQLIPSLRKINLSDIDIVKKIMKEVVMAFYRSQ